MPLIKFNGNTQVNMQKLVSILILIHSAPKYVQETFATLYNITVPDMLKNIEIVVVDNASDNETKKLLLSLKEKGYINKLYFSEKIFFLQKVIMLRRN